MDRKTFDAEISVFLADAAVLISREHGQKEMAVAYDWHPWEMALWNIGEQIRQFTIQHKKSLNTDQAHAIVDICLDPSAGKGRQSFVLLLGKTVYSPLAGQLSSLLSDADVCGHVINTLYKMKASGYAGQIRPFENHEQTWIRKEAKRYLEKYS